MFGVRTVEARGAGNTSTKVGDDTKATAPLGARNYGKDSECCTSCARTRCDFFKLLVIGSCRCQSRPSRPMFPKLQDVRDII